MNKTTFSAQTMLSELLLCHGYTKKQLSQLLNVPLRVINGILFKGYVESHTEQTLKILYNRVIFSPYEEQAAYETAIAR